MTEKVSLFSGTLAPDHFVVNRGTDEELVCYGYRESVVKRALFCVLVIVTLGLILLLMLWRPELECYLKKRRCQLDKADTLLLQNCVKQWFVCRITTKQEVVGIPSSVPGYHSVLSDSSSEESDTYSDTARLTAGHFTRDDEKLRYFDFQHVRYLWNPGLKTFERLQDLSTDTKCNVLQENYPGLSDKEQAQKRLLYGENLIDVEVKSYWRLFIEEVMNPFYVFQIFSIVLWMMDQYYYYAGCIFVISLISIGVALYEIKKQSRALHDMVATTADTIIVCRGKGEYEECPTYLLVPGDVIVIPQNGCTMTCDAALTAGTCIVNESMLTGESVPVTKTPLTHQEDEEIYSPDIHKRHTLFSGTHVMQTRYYGNTKVTAVVVRTAFSTAKGELVRSILFPKPLDFQFYRDSMKFILFLGFIAALGMLYTVIIYIIDGVSPYHIVLRVLDVVTIIVPAALPAAMTVGTVYAQSRLKKEGIYCISPPRINFCGRLDIICFDKTGTLTEDGLDMWGVVPVRDSRFLGVENDPSQLEQGPVLIAMASCHSLTLIGGELSGDPLDLIMFESTNWLLEEPGTDTSKFDIMMPTVVKPCTRDTFKPGGDQSPLEVGIIRQFTFSSNMQRMSVIARTLGENYMDLYCKGAPEKIASLCRPESVPHNFQEVLKKYTVQGHRVIALSWRPLDPKLSWHQAQRISRDKVEHDMTFLGLLVMQNKLKPQSKPVIQKLRAANVRSAMITGDMIETAISVARNCGMIPAQDMVIIIDAKPPDRDRPASVEYRYAEYHSGSGTDTSEGEEMYTVDLQAGSDKSHFAVSGKSLAVLTSHFPELLPRVCVGGTVFARMSPEQKCQLIENLQKLGYHVGMCGDGANDCEALKAAHAGISLSEAEASIAAPFTSHTPTIECVVTVMREGRAALTTSFAVFKYMALYSFIQFVSVMILYSFEVNLTDFQFLYIDLVITTSIAIFMGYTKAEKTLSAKRPPGSLVKLSNLLSIITQVILVAVAQVAGLLYLQSQSWYRKAKPNKDATLSLCWETTIIFLVSSYLYISVAFCFSKGPPFRRPVYTNIPYLLTLIFLVAFSTVLILLPPHPILKFFQIMPLWEKDIEFRALLLVIPVVHLILCWTLEYVLTSTDFVKRLKTCCCGKKKKRKATSHKAVRKEMFMSDWPPVGQLVYSQDKNFDPESQGVHEQQSMATITVHSVQ